MSDFDSSTFFKTLGDSKPNLRVLEVGNWARSPSTTALQSLTLPNSRNLWSQYTFATKNFVASEERLTGYLNLEYVTIDISEDPADQGFEGRQYDIVISNNALHTTPSLAQSLRNINKLLAPTGRLLLQEVAPASKWINSILGTTPA